MVSQDLAADEYLRHDSALVIPPKYAEWLERRAKITDEERRRIMVSDPAGYRFLVALHLSATAWRCRSVTDSVDTEHVQPSAEWLTTRAAAELLDVTPRCITKWCTSGRLRARRLGRCWMVHHSEIRAYSAELTQNAL